MIDDPDTSAADVAKVIQLDQGLTLQLLRLANSAAFGFTTEIKTVQRAIAALGLGETKGVVLAVAARGALPLDLPGYGLARGELWRHSISTALLSEAVADEIGHPEPQEAFVAGLLHDVGMTILSQYLAAGDIGKVMVERLIEEEVAFDGLEREFTDTDHAEIGSLVCARWGLWPGLVEAIGYHHRPQAPEIQYDRRLVQVVHVGDALSLMLGIGVGVDGLGYELDAQALAALGLTDSRVEYLMDRAAGSLDATMAEFMTKASS
jgi:putative nucleotidyltransferase with HDIG domain